MNGYYHGYDSYNSGGGTDIIKAEGSYTNIGLKGNFNSGNSIEEITANGYINVTLLGESDGNALDFTNTKLNGVIVDGNGGDDTITASSLSASSYRGGAGNDTLIGGSQNDTFLVNGYYHGYDSYNGGVGTDIIKAEGSYTNIGLKGDFDYLTNSIEEITGTGYTNVNVLGESTANILDFGSTNLTNISLVDAGGGNDTVTVGQLHSIVTKYIGGSGTDTLKYSNSLYDINTSTGIGYLDSDSSIAFTFSGFESYTPI